MISVLRFGQILFYFPCFSEGALFGSSVIVGVLLGFPGVRCFGKMVGSTMYLGVDFRIARLEG